MSWLLRVMRPSGSTETPSPLVPTPPSRLNPPSGGKPMVPLNPPSTTGTQTMTSQGSVTFPSPPSLPPSGFPLPPPSVAGRVITTGKRDTSPLQVQPAAVVIAAATIRNGIAQRVIGAVSTRGGAGACARRAHARGSGGESSGGPPGRSTLERSSGGRHPEGFPDFTHP